MKPIKRSGVLILSLAMIAAISGCPSPKGAGEYRQAISVLEKKGPTLEVKKLLAKALQDNPDLAEAYIVLGQTLMDEGFFVEASENSRKGVDLLEKNQRAFDTSKTWQQFASQGLTNMAIVEVRKGANLTDKSPEAAAKKKAAADLALSYFNRAVGLDPENKKAKDELALLKAVL